MRVEYQRIQKMLSEESEREIQKKSDREQRNWARLEEIKWGITNLRRNVRTWYDYQRLVWYEMEVYQAALRNEYRTLKVANYRESDNYIEGRKLVFNEYKTSRAMGRQEFEMSDEIEEDLTKLVKHRLERKQEYLFLKSTGQKFSSQEFGNAMMNGMERYVGGKRIGSQMLRKIVVSEMRAGEKSLEEKKEDSRKMLHSSYMNERYRRLEEV